MNIDKYISSYLDGELHPEDDAVFRALLTEYPELREEFEVAVNIHISMKSIADDIDVPDDLFESTAKAVEVIVRNEEDSSHTLITNSKILRPIVKRTSLVLTLLFLLVVQVDDYWFSSVSSRLATLQMLSYSTEIEPRTRRSVNRVKMQSSNSRNIQRQSSQEGSSETAFQTYSPAGATDNHTAPSVNLSDEKRNDSNIGLARESEIQGSLTNTNNQSISDGTPISSVHGIAKSSTPQVSSTLQEVYSNPAQGLEQSRHLPYTTTNSVIPPNINTEDIRLSTFATTLLSTSQQSILSTSISQSFDFPLTKESSIGFEIGAITHQEVVTNQRYVGMSYSSGDASGGLSSQGKILGGSGETSNSGGEYGSLNSTPKDYIKSMYWVSLSIDYSVYRYDLFQLHTRLGIGAANDGPMLIGRLYGSFDVHKQVSLTAGLDSRYFMINSIRNGFSIGSAVSTVSLMYGIQIRL